MNQELLKSMFHYSPTTGEFTRTHKVSKTGTLVKCSFISSSLGSAGYLRVSVNRKSYLVHRLVFLYMTGQFPTDNVDHVNGVRTDNRWSNLRTVDQRNNSMNTTLSVRNMTGTTGVFWDSVRERYMANIMVNGKTIFLGRFTDKCDAVTARLSANTEYKFHANHGKPICE